LRYCHPVLRFIKEQEIPLPSAPSHHALFSTYLCAAIPSSNTYSIIDLSDASLTEVLPFSQIDASVLEFEPNPNVVVVPGENEFLVTSYTGATTMGVFLNGQGDPVRGTMEWPQHPVTIGESHLFWNAKSEPPLAAVESGYIIALLRNQTIVVHHLSGLEKPAQVVTVDQTLRAFGLSYSPYGISIRDIVRDERMRMTRMLLLGGTLASTVVSPIKDFPPKLEVDLTSMDLPSSVEELSPAAEEPPSGSGLTPPSSPPPFKRQPITPTRGSSLLQATAPTARGPFSTTVAETLIIGPNGIQSFSPTPIITRLDKLCAGRRMDEAMALVDEERRKGRRGEIDGDKVGFGS